MADPSPAPETGSTVSTRAGSATATPPELAARFRDVRSLTVSLVDPLEPEDCVVQSMPDVSPAKWHLAHVTWFFETFVLEPHAPGYRPARPEFRYLFNSYYNAVGEQYPRPDRGLLTRPTLREVMDYRARVDEAVGDLLDSGGAPEPTAGLVELGLHHEQQHQELLLMDIKHVLSRNPLYPAYRRPSGTAPPVEAASPGERRWLSFEGGLREIGATGAGFSYDNERPRHRVWLEPFRLASRPVTNAEYLEFVEDGGYHRAGLWLADGRATAGREGWQAPLYWVRRDDGWHEFTLSGLMPLDPAAPVCHVSFYEADAFASWAGGRLPTEAEWETAAGELPVEGNLLDHHRLHPAPAPRAASGDRLAQAWGDVWEWTASAYVPYPGFHAPEGAIGEYNGKFMCNQHVLRGGSCATPASHLRPTYRNFFYPHCRWMFGGLRLAR